MLIFSFMSWRVVFRERGHRGMTFVMETSEVEGAFVVDERSNNSTLKKKNRTIGGSAQPRCFYVATRKLGATAAPRSQTVL